MLNDPVTTRWRTLPGFSCNQWERACVPMAPVADPSRAIQDAAALLRANGWRVEEPPVTADEKLLRQSRNHFEGWKAVQMPKLKPATEAPKLEPTREEWEWILQRNSAIAVKLSKRYISGDDEKRIASLRAAAIRAMLDGESTT